MRTGREQAQFGESNASRLSRADPSRTWVALPITTMFFKASICGIVGSGRSTLFWTDPWVDGHCISDLAPDLFLWRHVLGSGRC
jgi:hypothetical protein